MPGMDMASTMNAGTTDMASTNIGSEASEAVSLPHRHLGAEFRHVMFGEMDSATDPFPDAASPVSLTIHNVMVCAIRTPTSHLLRTPVTLRGFSHIW
jgi:hypothetical protein